MKKLSLLTLVLLLGSGFLFAQTSIKKVIPGISSKPIVMDFRYADVKIKAWDKSEIEITGSVDINDGENDENFTISIDDEAEKINIKTFVKDADQLPVVTVIKQDGNKIFVKKKPGKSSISSFKDYKNAHIWTESVPVDITLEIFVPRQAILSIASYFGDVKLENLSNDIKVENKHGRLEAVFNETPINQPIKLKSKHNVVDVSLPATAKLDVNLRSKHGRIFSDMKIDSSIKSDGLRSLSPKTLEGTLNGGGSLLDLESTHNKIYLRKNKS